MLPLPMLLALPMLMAMAMALPAGAWTSPNRMAAVSPVLPMAMAGESQTGPAFGTCDPTWR